MQWLKSWWCWWKGRHHFYEYNKGRLRMRKCWDCGTQEVLIVDKWVDSGFLGGL